METTNNETKKIITKEDALKDLSVIAKEDEYTEKSGLDKELATLIYTAYRKGVDEYQTRYWNEKSAREMSDNKFSALAVKMAEQLIEKQVTVAMKF